MKRKLTENADHCPTKQAKITYVDSFVKYLASLHLASKPKNNVINKFTTTEEMFEALYAIYREYRQETYSACEISESVDDQGFQLILG